MTVSTTTDIPLALFRHPLPCEQMPVMDGNESIMKIREWEATQEGRAPVWVIVLTAHASEEDRKLSVDAGAPRSFADADEWLLFYARAHCRCVQISHWVNLGRRRVWPTSEACRTVRLS